LKYLLDNDTFNHILRGNPLVSNRLKSREPDTVVLSAIAALESLRGTLAAIAKTEAKDFKPSRDDAVELVYRSFITKIEVLAKFTIIPYDDTADKLFRSWSDGAKRIGANDCRIAASAIVHGLIVVTCNTSHFEQIADRAKLSTLRWEDWSLPSNLEKS
jgi:predicted nucleic acid-binding protein